MSNDLLNKVQSLLINFANESGISLKSEFGTIDAFKQFVIAFTFKMLTNLGIETEKAFDLVFGSGEYNALAESVWNSAN